MQFANLSSQITHFYGFADAANIHMNNSSTSCSLLLQIVTMQLSVYRTRKQNTVLRFVGVLIGLRPTANSCLRA